MKILFISPRPFGLMGTPGTYHLVSAYARHVDVRVIASDKKDSNVSIVYRPPSDLDLHEVAFGVPGYASRIAEIAREFRPDIVCLGNYHGWFEIVERVKRDLPRAKYVLDIKSPLISESNSARQVKIQTKGAKAAHLLDLIVTRCTEDVESWIPNCNRPIFIYPLGVKLSQFSPRLRDGAKVFCSRFVFIGSFSKNRKLEKLIDFIAALPPALLREITIDMYGSGPEKENLVAYVSHQHLEHTIRIHDQLPQDELLARLGEYDAGLGWVPREIYDAAPSLKVLEYLGSGLVPVISATQGHIRNIEDGFRGILFEENSESFGRAIEQACSDGFPIESIESNLKRIEGRDWDIVARKYLLPAFDALLSESLPNDSVVLRIHQNRVGHTIFSQKPTPRDVGGSLAESVRSRPRMRILLISPRPFGLLGTPGTYYLAEAYAQHAEICVIANRQTTQAVRIVHRPSQKINLHEVAFQTRRYLKQIAAIAHEFQPDVVWIGNFNYWPDVVVRLKQEFPQAKFVLDVKSPLLTGHETQRRHEIQLAGANHASYLDLIIALSTEDVQTWIPGFAGRLMRYPLGVDLAQFRWRALAAGILRPKRFVYVGSYQEARQLDVLLGFIAELPPSLLQEITFDMYGDGPDRSRLQNIVQLQGLDKVVRIHDCLDQTDLFDILPEYDAGIGWVPQAQYDTAPPLKTLEFMGSGLIPIVTNTTAHRRYQNEGYELITFDENQESFRDAITRVFADGFDTAALVRNRTLLAQRDFQRVVLDWHLPAYQAIIDNKPIPSGLQAGRAVDTSPACSRKVTSAYVEDVVAESPKISPQAPKYWAPPVVNRLPTKRERNSSVRVAGVLGERLTAGLRFECVLLPVISSNWRNVLRYAGADMLLIEGLAQLDSEHSSVLAASSPAVDEFLYSVVREARALSIPTVLWMTGGHESVEQFKDFARHFDLVCCADPKSVDLLSRHGVRAEALLPCVQPAVWNPFRHYEQKDACKLDIVFDGWSDIADSALDLSVIRKLEPLGLRVIESRHEMQGLRAEGSAESWGYILGCVTVAARTTALKYGKAYATHKASLTTETAQQWMSIEAAACRLPIVHFGALADGDMRKDFATACPTEEGFIGEFVRYQKDDLYRERAAHRGWREVNLHHTFAHRLQRICKLLGIVHDWVPYPKVSLLMPTCRKELLGRCLATYEQTNYPNKELVIIFNGDELPTYQDLGLEFPRSDIHIKFVPSDMFAGAALNLGHAVASGKYVFRVDDDDLYGANYVLDMTLLAECIGARLFGKAPVPLAFEGDIKAYAKKANDGLMIVGQDNISVGDVWLGGNTVSGRREFFSDNPYVDTSYGTADTAMQLNARFGNEDVIALMDGLNVVAQRRHDPSSHTWKVNLDAIRKERATVPNFNDLFL